MVRRGQTAVTLHHGSNPRGEGVEAGISVAVWRILSGSQPDGNSL